MANAAGGPKPRESLQIIYVARRGHASPDYVSITNFRVAVARVLCAD